MFFDQLWMFLRRQTVFISFGLFEVDQFLTAPQQVNVLRLFLCWFVTVRQGDYAVGDGVRLVFVAFFGKSVSLQHTIARREEKNQV